MRVNANTTIQGSVAILVPYKPEHVPRYHEWMQDPHLQETTASEPLTIEEEYEMQRSWAEDRDKLTFIVLDRGLPDTAGTGSHGGAMAGDVNLFFTLDDDEDGQEGGIDESSGGGANGNDNTAAGGRRAAEIEVMIAETTSRGKGLAKEALRMLMAYATRELGVLRYVAKIHEVNQPSRRLFEGLGFVEFHRVPVFGEVHYELKMADASSWLPALQDSLTYGTYDMA